MSFADRPPSTQWAALKYRGETFAEVWFKPEGDPFALTFRIPQNTIHVPGLAQRLTLATLLKAVGIAPEEVASWHPEDASPPDPSDSLPELDHPLLPPAQDVPHLTLCVRLKAPSEAAAVEESGVPGVSEPAAAEESGVPEVSEAKWQELEARWKAILDLEASMDTLRISMESLRSEMESSSRRMLAPDEKVHALNADVAQWNKAKSRVLYAVPKVREFIHRSTWAAGTPERKQLEELYKSHIRPRVPFSQIDDVMVQLDNLMKDRQVLFANGMSVFQECKGTSADVQGALRNLQSNAAANATKKRAEAKSKRI